MAFMILSVLAKYVPQGQVKINLSLIDAIKQIHAYAKFSKDLCTQKRKLKATLPKKINLTEHVSAVLSSSLPPKFKDPGAPLISVVVGNIAIKKALLDLGASINILPASLVDKYDLGTLRKTDTIISLADRSTKIPRGILEDVIVKVDDFYYPVDFFVMDTESPYKDVQPTIILGRPFLATIDARINCRTGAMDIAFGNKKLRLNVFNFVNSPTMNEYYQVDVIDEEVQKHEWKRGQMISRKRNFLAESLEECSLQSQQVNPKRNYEDKVQEYFDCLLVHQDVLPRARGSNKVSCQSCHVAASNWPAANDVAATSSATWPINAGQWSVNGGQPSVNGGQWWSTTGQRPTTIGLSPDHRLTTTGPSPDHHRTTGQRWSKIGLVALGQGVGRVRFGSGLGRVATCQPPGVVQRWLGGIIPQCASVTSQTLRNPVALTLKGSPKHQLRCPQPS
ncbi:putative nucleotidyltransferase, ribonuclease H [Tanacetum coccineum]